jgi:hypothetical protein
VLGGSTLGVSGLRRRIARGGRAGGEAPAPGAEVRLRTSLFVSGTDGQGAFRGRAVAVAVDPGANAGADRTRYLVEDAARDAAFWVAETEIERTYPLLPGDAVIGYMTVQPGTRASARRAAVSALRLACGHAGWRLDGVVCDSERDGVLERPGLARALERIARREAAGLLVVDVDRAAGTPAALADLMGAVRAAGGGFTIVEDEDRAAAVSSNRRAAVAQRAAVARRIAELRAEGLAPQAVADALNEEGVPPPGVELAWHPWSVREASGTWPPRGPDRRLPRGPGSQPR